MSVPSDRKYSETHEWFMPEGDVVKVGISQYAADELTDITYVELPEVGSRVEGGQAIGEVESVKATSELLSAVAGEVIEVNGELGDRPELINEDAFGEGWIAKIKVDSVADLDALLDAEAYAKVIQN